MNHPLLKSPAALARLITSWISGDGKQELGMKQLAFEMRS